MASDEGARGEGAARGAGEARAPVRYCAVYDCTHKYSTHPQLAYFGFPSDKEKVKLWAEKIRRPDIVQANGRVSSYYRVCEEHFHPSHVVRNDKRRRLLRRAVPARRLPHPGPYVHVAAVAAPAPLQINGKTLVRSTLEVCEYIEEAPRSGKTKKKKAVIRPAPSAALPVLAGSSDCGSPLAPSAAQFVTLVARLQAARSDKELCVKFLHSSPQAYRLLQASLGLPTVLTLHRHCAPRLPNFLNTLDLLKTRVGRMTDVERHCTLSVDVIEARRLLYYNITFDRIVGLHEIDGMQKPDVATRGVVVSAKGLLSSWTQPVALCYLAHDDETFNPWLEKIIGSLHRIGLKVRALVCDPSTPPTFRDVTPDRPFFFVGGTKIYLLYDPPRLMKYVLCALIGYNFYVDKGSARWSDVLEYRKIERNKVLTLTPGLTDASTKASRVRRMPPRRAARVLSRALATALAARADQGLLADSARATASFIIKLNNLYDLLNSNTMQIRSEFKKGLSRDLNQTGFLMYMKSFFKSLKMEDSVGVAKVATKRVSDSWGLTIEAVLELQKDLQPLQPYLLTRNLHMDDSIAQSARRASRTLKPSCQEIFTAFKMQFFHGMLQPDTLSDFDLNGLLARVVNDAAISPQTVPLDSLDVHDDILVQASDYRQPSLAKKRSVMSVAKYLLHMASRVHSDCKLAVEYMNVEPQPDFLQLVRHLDGALRGAAAAGAGAGGLLRDLLLDVHVLDCWLPCPCFPLDYLKRLFFRLRLYSLLKQNQKRFKSGAVDLKIESLE